MADLCQNSLGAPIAAPEIELRDNYVLHFGNNTCIIFIMLELGICMNLPVKSKKSCDTVFYFLIEI